MEKYDILEPDFFYHIYNRGNNKENLFLEEENYIHFFNLIKKHLCPIVHVYAYCLLKNHFHLLIKIKSKIEIEDVYSNINNLSQPFSNLFNAYTKAINKKYDRDGSLFKVRFKRERIDNDNYLRNVITYIHLNPVKHRFANDFCKYEFSSFNSIMSVKPTLLKRVEVLKYFENRENFLFVHKECLRKGMYEEFD